MSDKINVLISEEDVEKRIQEIGTAISKEYEGKCVHLQVQPRHRIPRAHHRPCEQERQPYP